MCQAAPVAKQAWTDTLAHWPGVTFLGIVGDQNHQTRHSSHNCAPMQESGNYDPNYAHALDVGHGGNRTLAAAIRVAFLADPRTRYVIDNGTGYKPDGSTFRSTGHTTHVHVSFQPGTTFDTRPFHGGTTQGDEDLPLNDADLFTIGVIVKKALADMGLATLDEAEKRRAKKTRERLARIEAELAEG